MRSQADKPDPARSINQLGASLLAALERLAQAAEPRPVDASASEVGAHHQREERLAVSVSEAATLLGISRALAYELVARSEIPAVRLGHRLVVPKRALDELIAPRRPTVQ